MRSLRLLAMVPVLLATPAWSQGPSDFLEGEILALYEAGDTAYKSFCGHCHGLKMVNPGTTTYDLRKWPTDNPGGFYDSVRNGKGDMPAWGDTLYPEEIDALWVYVATRNGTQAFPKEAEVPADVAAANTLPTETE